jgi:hypothetical protein
MRSSLIRRSAAVAVVLLAGVSLVASSSTPSEPSTSPVTTGSPTTPVEPTLPAAAQKATKAGAEAFVEYYWEVVSYALVTGDLQRLTALAGPDCDGCDGGADFIRRVYDKNGSITADPYGVESANCRRLATSTGTASFLCEAVTKSSAQVIRIPGEKTQRIKPVRENFSFTLLLVEGNWRVDVLEAT